MEEYVKKYGLAYEKTAENALLGQITFEEVDAIIAQETPMIRLAKAFWKDKYGKTGPDVKYLSDSAFHVGFLSFFFCNYFAGKHAHLRWHATNQISVFETRYKAIRAYMDYVFVKSISQSVVVALKFTSFAMIFIGGSKAIAVANNKTKITDYTAAGFLAGSIMKLNMGFRGTAVAGFLGAVLGTLAGAIIYPMQKYANLTEEERHRAVVAVSLAQERYFDSLLASGQKIPTASDERRKRSAERIQVVKDYVRGKKALLLGNPGHGPDS